MEALWILLVPLIWFFFAKYWLRHTFSYKEMAISITIVSLLVVGTVQLGKFGQTQDTEVWNGYVTDKDRKHGSYQTSYCCGGTDKNGMCQMTCYTDHYTVNWTARTTLGAITLQHLDRTSRSVYNSPDPAIYKRCYKGEPASIEKSYTNYVQAVPQSLFHDDGTTASAQFAGKIPNYPRVHSKYQFNRVINKGAKVDKATINKIDAGLDDALKTLGRQKQANIIVILTNITDPSYRYAVEQSWLGGKKNDIVIFVGLDGNKIVWTDIMTWALNSGNELFHVTMRDGILAQETLDADKFVPFVSQTVTKLYDRPQMSSYEYLADEIDPPNWVLWLAAFFAFGGSAILTFIFHRNRT